MAGVSEADGERRTADALWFIAVAGAFTLSAVFLSRWFGPIPLWVGAGFGSYAVFRIWLKPATSKLLTLPLAILFVFSVPWVWSTATKAMLTRYVLADISAPKPIVPAGKVLMETGMSGRGRAEVTSCDTGCLGLLLSRSVTSVTVAQTRDRTLEQIRNGDIIATSRSTFSLRLNGDCETNTTQPNLRSNRVGWRAAPLVKAEWRNLEARGACLVQIDTPRKFDLVIRNGVWGKPKPPAFSAAVLPDGSTAPLNRFGWSSDGCTYQNPTPPDLVGFSYSEIRTGTGTLLFRRQHVFGHTLAAPLSISGSRCSFASRGSFVWKPLDDDARSKATQAAAAAAAAIAFTSPGDAPEFVQELRNTISQALRGRADDSFALVEDMLPIYFDQIGKHGSTEMDLQLIERLIGDERMQMRSVARLPAVLDNEAMVRVRRAAARKLLRGPIETHPHVSLVTVWLAEPRIVLGGLLPEERQLLSTATDDYRSLGLVQRLPELGAEAAPILAAMLVGNTKAQIENGPPYRDGISRNEQRRRTARLWVAEEIVKSLCRMGPNARKQYGRLHAFYQNNRREDYFPLQHNWDKMFVAISGQTDGIRRPSGRTGTDDQYHAVLKSSDGQGCEPRNFFGL